MMRIPNPPGDMGALGWGIIVAAIYVAWNWDWRLAPPAPVYTGLGGHYEFAAPALPPERERILTPPGVEPDPLANPALHLTPLWAQP